MDSNPLTPWGPVCETNSSIYVYVWLPGAPRGTSSMFTPLPPSSWVPMMHRGGRGMSSWPISNHLIETVGPPVPTEAGPHRFDQMLALWPNERMNERTNERTNE